MPAVRTTPRDVSIRVPKVEPYSNRYVPPTVRAKEEAKKGVGAAGEGAEVAAASASAAAVGSAVSTATEPVNNGNSATGVVGSADQSSVPAPLAAATATDAPTTATATTTTTTTTTTTAAAAVGGTTNTEEESSKDRSQRGNSPILPFLSVDREEEQTVELSKAATSSAGWNSLLVWAAANVGLNGTNPPPSGKSTDTVENTTASVPILVRPIAINNPALKTQQKVLKQRRRTKVERWKAIDGDEEDEDKGPTRVSGRNRAGGEDPAVGAGAGNAASPPPTVSHGRSIRLLRR